MREYVCMCVCVCASMCVCVCVCVCVCEHVCACERVYVYVRVMPVIACPKTALYPRKKTQHICKKPNISVNYSVPMHAPGVGIFSYMKHMYALTYVCIYIYEYVHVYIYIKM